MCAKLENLLVFFFPLPWKAGGANVDGSGFVRGVVVQGCLCVVREEGGYGGL